MKKHAYLIICHNNFKILEKLIHLLDDPRNDIYVHVDRKVKQLEQQKKNLSVKNASLTFTKRISVNWGGFSQIKAELTLLEEAVKLPHDYYHLLSGVDLPLKPQDEIHNFFEKNHGKEFIGIDEQSDNGKEFEARVRYYRFLQDMIGRKAGLHIALLERIEAFLLACQKFIGINRSIHFGKTIYKGPNWFSITQKMAECILSQRIRINKQFKYGLCVDELFLQTLAMESPYAKNIINDSLRYIDWNRGSPYTFHSDDFDELMNSGKMFARKFDENTDMAVVNRIYETLAAH